MHIHLPLFRLFLSVLLNMCPSSSGHILFSESTLQLLLVVNRPKLNSSEPDHFSIIFPNRSSDNSKTTTLNLGCVPALRIGPLAVELIFNEDDINEVLLGCSCRASSIFSFFWCRKFERISRKGSNCKRNEHT